MMCGSHPHLHLVCLLIYMAEATLCGEEEYIVVFLDNVLRHHAQSVV